MHARILKEFLQIVPDDAMIMIRTVCEKVPESAIPIEEILGIDNIDEEGTEVVPAVEELIGGAFYDPDQNEMVIVSEEVMQLMVDAGVVPEASEAFSIIKSERESIFDIDELEKEMNC